MNAMRMGAPINAPGTPHVMLQKNTEKMTAKGEIANEGLINRDMCRISR